MSGRILPFGPRLAAVPEPLPPAGRSRRSDTAEAALSPADQARFRQMLLPHLDAAYSFARFLCRDASLAEDLVQDAFLRAFRGFAGFRGGDPKAWLFAIVRSSHLTWARSRGATPAGADAIEDAPAEDDTPE